MDSRSEQKNKNNLETIRQNIMNIGTQIQIKEMFHILAYMIE